MRQIWLSSHIRSDQGGICKLDSVLIVCCSPLSRTQSHTHHTPNSTQHNKSTIQCLQIHHKRPDPTRYHYNPKFHNNPIKCDACCLSLGPLHPVLLRAYETVTDFQSGICVLSRVAYVFFASTLFKYSNSMYSYVSAFVCSCVRVFNVLVIVLVQ